MKVKIKLRFNQKENSKIKAYVGLAFDECFVVNGIKLVEGKNGLFVAYPSYKNSDGEYKDIAYPLDKGYRDLLTKEIISKYEKEIDNHKEIDDTEVTSRYHNFE